MIRLFPIIMIAVIACVLTHKVEQRNNPATAPTVFSANANVSDDPAVALRELTGTTRPSKLWADDFAGFVSSRPGQWVVGHSPTPCLDEPTAAQAARTDAANAVWQAVTARLGQTGGPDWLRNRVTADVVAGRLDADHLAEQFQRPYGTIWTEAVLLDVSPDRLDSLLKSYKGEDAQRHRHESGIREAVGISIFGAWLGYLFLNAVTKGYFTFRLRLAAMLVTAVGVALLI